MTTSTEPIPTDIVGRRTIARRFVTPSLGTAFRREILQHPPRRPARLVDLLDVHVSHQQTLLSAEDVVNVLTIVGLVGENADLRDLL